MEVGDFNLPGIVWSQNGDKNDFIATNVRNSNAKLFCDSIAQENLSQLNVLQNPFGNVLDLCFANDTDRLLLLEVAHPMSRIDTPHRPFIVEIECNDSPKPWNE